MTSLRVGWARADITPDDAPLTIYDRVGYALGDPPIRDRLYARCMAFRSSETAAVWITLDTIALTRALRDAVASELARYGVPSAGVIVSATHTHTAPTLVRFHGVLPTPDPYAAALKATVIRIASEALASAEVADIVFGQAEADLSVNRREIGRLAQINDYAAASGLVDPQVTVVAFSKRRSKERACLVNYTAHPLSMSGPIPCISSDYPGRMVDALERTGVVDHAQFIQGCAGNVNIKVHGDTRESTEAGERLAAAVSRALGTAVPMNRHALRLSAVRARLPWQDIPTLEEARIVLASERAKNAAWPRMLEWAEDVLAALESGDALPHTEVPVHALRIGDAVLVALPGEVFVEIGLAVKERSESKPVLVGAYANACEIGYIPTAAAFGEGGYEVDLAPFYYGLFKLAPACEQILTDAALAAVAAVG